MQITTERLTLREFESDDWPAVLAYQQDPRYLEFYPWSTRTESDVKEFVQWFLDEQAESPRRRFQLAVVRRDTGALIGNCGIRRKPDSDQEADIGYEIAPEHWGRGYATEAAAALIEHGFTEMGLHRVSSWCIAGNGASARVLAKLGLQQEGRLRENEFFKGRWWDTLVFGLLKNEWSPPKT
ncbi:MAG: GNAT family protein [Chloroflexi bacterium]|nr:GNAT family protein [Chloroflexota bacterium]MDA1271014.1 GNAT family protein [Chloroflexota bacterium]PKB58239.1 MAG: GNAT family N-acetyltransferase [SAR202 cluster bacterium Casp-Chloro-G2]